MKEQIGMKKQLGVTNNHQMNEGLNNAQAGKNAATNHLTHLKTQLEEAKRQLENLKNKKVKKAEESKTFLASEKLANTKKGPVNDSGSKSGSQTPRRSRKK